MPRNYKRRQRRPRKRTQRSGFWGSAGSLAKTALKTAKWVAGLVNAEYKAFDINAAPLAANWNGQLYGPLCAPPQGLTYADRAGDSIKMKDLTIRFKLTQNAAIQETVRVIIFIDKQNTILTGANYLQATGTSNVVLSPKNYNNVYSSKTIYDQCFTITNTRPTVTVSKVFKINLHTHFQAGTTTATNNAIKMIVYSQQISGGTTMQYYSHMTYVDN